MKNRRGWNITARQRDYRIAQQEFLNSQKNDFDLHM